MTRTSRAATSRGEKLGLFSRSRKALHCRVGRTKAAGAAVLAHEGSPSVISDKARASGKRGKRKLLAKTAKSAFYAALDYASRRERPTKKFLYRYSPFAFLRRGLRHATGTAARLAGRRRYTGHEFCPPCACLRGRRRSNRMKPGAPGRAGRVGRGNLFT